MTCFRSDSLLSLAKQPLLFAFISELLRFWLVVLRESALDISFITSRTFVVEAQFKLFWKVYEKNNMSINRMSGNS